MKDIILQTENLSKSFKGQKIVEDLSLTIPRNTVYGLLGPNGAGKSTTLKMFRVCCVRMQERYFFMDMNGLAKI